ncbi:MAG TPA: pyridoxamine 5'-phosphate oxidase [Actinomycetota bacterium]|nr:pyridoxamine 5'-phosphate oxidase [Actinomycetota bacterium]
MTGPELGDEPFAEGDLDPDPVAQLRSWLAEAERAGIQLHDAMALATADAAGHPAVRHVLLKGLDGRGLTFFTNRQSRKGRHLAENQQAAVAFLWRELHRQASALGTVSPIAEEESFAYFRTRPREARLGAWASRQSARAGSREELDGAYRRMAERFPDDDVPLPPNWGGYRLVPEEFEFWKGRRHRLHDRFRYIRVDRGWRIERLYP